jgi:predicted secreted protein
MHEIHLIAHCLINPTVRLQGLKPLSGLNVTGNIIQLPCPETVYFGLKRWEVTSEQLDMPNYRRFCRHILLSTIDTIQMLFREGYNIRLIGVAGSPSCGAKTTSIGFKGGHLCETPHTHIQGTGIFFDEIIKELKYRDIEYILKEVNSI